MRRITLWVASTIAAVVLLLSYRTSQGPSAADANDAGAAGAGGAVGGQAGATAPAPAAGAKAATVSGPVAQTRWGPVQVQVVISGGRLTDVRTLQYPNGNGRDAQINAYALPQLRTEALQAQSAQIDTVSGATITSGGYVRSLQAALDTAHFG